MPTSMATVQLSQSHHQITHTPLRHLTQQQGSFLIVCHAYHNTPTRTLHPPHITGSTTSVIGSHTAQHWHTHHNPHTSQTPQTTIHGPHNTHRHSTCTMSRCPERHFRGNQLPGSSIGLSPLYPSHAIELHVRTTESLQQTFTHLHSKQT